MTSIEQASKEFMQAAEKLPVLYELRDEYVQLAAVLEDLDESALSDVEKALAERLDELEGSIKAKADNIVGLARSYEAIAEARRNEARRMTDGAKRYETRAEWLRTYLLDAMQAIGSDRIETSKFTISVRQNPPKVEVLEARDVPAEYQRTKVSIDVDRGEVLRHFKSTGEVPPGIEITRGQRLDIR